MGFSIGKKGTAIEHAYFDGFDIGLLARGDGVEFMVQHIQKDNIFYIYPSDNPDVIEFYYILQGEMICELNGEKIKLGANDYYTASNLKEPIHFTPLTDIVYLWIITEPTFYQLSESISNLTNIVAEVEKKDSYTYKHSERVALFAVKIAKKLMLPKEKLENVYISSLLHDIGKVHTPSEILNKPGKLTVEEYEIVKRHPADGAKMVKDLYYDGIASIIEQHHERLDGSGYPYGLKGDQISLEARIIAVSDAFDAMTEDRAYRKAFSKEFALSELKRLVTTHYDPDVVAVFEEILEEEDIIAKV
jgi:putative nucleotidyltransferase with HDIG domain